MQKFQSFVSEFCEFEHVVNCNNALMPEWYSVNLDVYRTKKTR